jgi:DNA mismatch repair protein MutL
VLAIPDVEPIIAVLAPHVIDQIAAGEVIERPASVVKELVDNAIDAGATSITIDVAGGGRTLVRVSDDGCGMSAQAVMLALERHATSKLREVDDLWSLSSMGFRGEALPAIASVSRMTLTTRRAGADAATRVTIEGGRVVAVTEAGAPVGTTVEVTDLLYNLPARQKFLKGEATEAAQVTDLVAKVAMAYPRLHVRLKHNGRTSLDVPPDRDGHARAQALLGPRVAARLFPITGEEAGVRVTAYLAAPELAQATARGVQLFVGRRPVRDRGLLHALAMGYGELVPRGRYPLAIVMVDVPAGAVDVNVHPQKLEVRFADAAAVAAAVRHVVQSGVSAARWREQAGGPGPIQVHASVAPPALPFDGHGATAMAERQVAQMRSRQVPLGFSTPVAPEPAPSSTSARAWARDLRDQNRASRVAEPSAAWPTLEREPSRATGPSTHPVGASHDGEAAAAGAGDARGAGDRAVVDAASRSTEAGDPRGDAEPVTLSPAVTREVALDPVASVIAASPPGFFAQLRFLGQLDLTYLVCEGDGELVLVDQHAAHERVELARLRDRQARSPGESRIAVQRMLFPVTLEVSAAQLAIVARLGDLLAQVGFDVEPFGKTTVAVKAVPAGIRHGDPAHLLRRLLEDWAETGAPSEAERLDALLAEIACHSVVRAGDRLTAGEAETLLRSLDGVDLTQPAPHGRGVLLRVPFSEIGRRFGR